MLHRSIGDEGGINIRPELTPADDVQGHMWAMSMQGGGEIYLGPYDFIVQSKAKTALDGLSLNYLTVPANVSLIGVPNKTRIFKVAYYNEVFAGDPVPITAKSMGPVVVLGGDGAGIYNCTVFLDAITNSPSDGGYVDGFRGPRSLPLLAQGFWVYDSDGNATSTPVTSEKNYCLIYIDDAKETKIHNCVIGDPLLSASGQLIEGIFQSTTGLAKAMITNNIFKVDCGVSMVSSDEWVTAGIYIADNSYDNVAVGNISSFSLQGTALGFTAGAFVSVRNPADMGKNAVDKGNVPRVCCTTIDNGLRNA